MYTTTQTYKHYYPFGLKHGSYYSTANIELAKKGANELVPQNLLDGELKIKPTTDRAYKYKYNGKEWQDELDLNVYAYGWRDYDPAIGRFNKIDRFAEKYYGLSTYSYAGNNPVIFVDIQGDSIAKGSQDEWNKQKKNVKTKMYATAAKLLNTLLSGGDIPTGTVSALGEAFISLNQTLGNLNDLEDSNQIYALNNTAATSELRYDANGNIVICYNTTTLFVHEAKHAGQFESQDIGFDSEIGTSYAQDVYDEIDAYKAQYAFSPKSVKGITSPTRIKSVTDINKSWIQNISDRKGDKIYAPGGSANTAAFPVNINSTRLELIKAYNLNPNAVPENFTLKTYSTLVYKK